MTASGTLLRASGSARDLRQDLHRALSRVELVASLGRVVEARGTLVRVAGLDARIGELCELRLAGGRFLLGEVTGLADDGALLMLHGDMRGVSLGVTVKSLGRGHFVGVGEALLGRVLDGFGQPRDGLGPLRNLAPVPVMGRAPDPLKRQPIQAVFETGVRAIDGLITLGEGQRVGVFAPAGVGKSTLCGMVLNSAAADVCVVALIGERGREVGEFVGANLGQSGMERCVVVAATSDSPASERINAAFTATAIAESFRERGQRVLLVMDSLTRLARALREVGLANGEPPTRRGYPPSVFAALPQLLERAGNSENGVMTAIYTVLVEGENDDDPIAEEVRSILDGHIVLTRAVAQQPCYPAIDVLQSLSRLMPAVSDTEHRDSANRLRSLLAKYREIELLVQVGEYRAGSDPLADEALAKRERIRRFLAQDSNASARAPETLAALHGLVAA